MNFRNKTENYNDLNISWDGNAWKFDGIYIYTDMCWTFLWHLVTGRRRRCWTRSTITMWSVSKPTSSGNLRIWWWNSQRHRIYSRIKCPNFRYCKCRSLNVHFRNLKNVKCHNLDFTVNHPSFAGVLFLLLYAQLVGTYNGVAQASVRLSVHKACRPDTDWTIPARTLKLGTLTTYDKRMNPIDFQGQVSKVKVTRNTLLLNLINRIQTEPFKLGPSNLVHILLMTRGRHLLISKVRGHRSRSYIRYTLLLNLVNTIQTEPLQLINKTFKLGTLTTYDKRTNPIDFQGQGQRSRSHVTHCC